MKVDEEIYCDFEKVKILQIRNNKITFVGDEYFSMGSSDLTPRCVPITVNSKYVSDRIRSYFEMVRETKNSMNLYTGEIKAQYVQMWLKALSVEMRSDTQEDILSDAWEFTKLLLEKIEEINNTEVMGVRLFR